MRLEMNRVAGLAVAVTALVFSSSCCCKPNLRGDIFSGAPKGSALVKVEVTLVKAEAGCSVRVNPERVIVFPGSAIRWRVKNGSKEAQGCQLNPNYIGFTQPRPRPAGRATIPSPEAWNYRLCAQARIDPVYDGDDDRNVLFCEVPDTTRPGLYKYGLEGGVRLDPEIEVRPGGGKGH